MKKRTLQLIFITALVIVAFCSAFMLSNAETSKQNENELSISAYVDGVEINSVDVEKDHYLFLPASADIKNIKLSFNGNEQWNLVNKMSGEKIAPGNDYVDLTPFIYQDEESHNIIDAVSNGGKKYSFVVMQGENISTMYLSSADMTQDRTWVDQSKENEATGYMKMVKADGSSVYDGELTQIKARGNSTFAFYTKKPYQIKLKDKTDLLNTGEKVKTWVLLANYADATQMHDKLFKDLAAEIDMDYVASCNWVNLYYDGEYRGVYLLSEKNSVGSTSVDIHDLEEEYEAVNDRYGKNISIGNALNRYGYRYLYTKKLAKPESIKGGYLIELSLDNVDEASGFYTRQGVALNVKSPEWADKEAMEYISEYYQAFEDAVYSIDAEGNFTGYNVETGKHFYEYVDMESLVKMFILQELSRNPDGFRSSLYFYKDVDGLMYAGPIWDQDLTLGNSWMKYSDPETISLHYLAEALIKIPEFKEAVTEYYEETFSNEIKSLIANGGVIDKYYDTIQSNVAMNSVLWPFVRVGNPDHEMHLWQEGTDYDTVINDMKEWIEVRLDVMNYEYGHGDTQSEIIVDLNKTDVESAIANDDTINLEIEPISITKNEKRAKQLVINTGTDKSVKIQIPVDQLTYGTVAMILTSDGSWDIITNTSHTSNGIMISIENGDQIKVVDLAKDFADVSDNDWEKNAVDYASARGILNGISETLFGPDGTATRGMICTVLARIAGQDTTPSGDEHWQQPGLDWALNTGVSDGTNPDSPITRQQLATMLYRYVGEPENQGSLDSFEDRAKVSSWAEEAMKWAVENEIFKGDGEGHLNPDNNATRAEIAQVMMNFMIKGAN